MLSWRFRAKQFWALGFLIPLVWSVSCTNSDSLGMDQASSGDQGIKQGREAPGTGGTDSQERVSQVGGRASQADEPNATHTMSFASLHGRAVTSLSYQASSDPSGVAGAGAEDGGELEPVDFIEPSGTVCTGEWRDFGCDAIYPLFPVEENCPGDARMDYRSSESCPVCVSPPDSEPSCEETRRRYLEFLDHNLRETCSNWCEADADCTMTPLSGCGLRHVVSLYGGVDEELLAFSKAFDLENCGVCPELAEGDPTLPPLTAACRQNQCVLISTKD